MALTKVTSGLISADASLVDLNIDAGTLYIDATNNRVGVGNTSPTDKLHVGTSSGGTQLKIQSGSSVNNCVLYTNGTTDSWRTGMNLLLTNGSYEFYDDVNNVDRMVITSSGNVGVGTSSPATGLHIAQYGTAGEDCLKVEGQVRLEGQGRTRLTLTAANAASSYKMWNFDNSAGTLRIFNEDYSSSGIGSNGVLRITLDNSGHLFLAGTSNFRVGLSNNSPTNNTEAGFLAGGASAYASAFIQIPNNAVNGYGILGFYAGSTLLGNVTKTGANSVAYNTSSDYRLKENVDYNFNALERVAQLKPARFNFIAEADKTVDGFIAHEVSDIVPEAITGVKDEMQEEEYEVTPAVLDEEDNIVTEAVMGTREVPKYQGIDQSKLVPLLTKAIQEQQTLIEELKTRIETLENA